MYTLSFDPVVGLVILSFIVVGALIVRHIEKKDWNNGVCAESGKPWKQFDTASDGSRGYSDGQGNYCWISYNVDK